MGGKGCEFAGRKYPTKKVEVKDLSGAGDTFMAGLVVKFIETQDIEKSIKFANQCASKVVTQKGSSSAVRLDYSIVHPDWTQKHSKLWVDPKKVRT